MPLSLIKMTLVPYFERHFLLYGSEQTRNKIPVLACDFPSPLPPLFLPNPVSIFSAFTRVLYHVLLLDLVASRFSKMDFKDYLVPRTDTTCTGDKLWYVCTAGDYKGCCSSNPCTSGVCPDDDTTTSSTTKTTTTFQSSSTPSNDSTSTSSEEGTTTATAEATSSLSSMGSSSPSTIASATSTSTSTAAPESSSSSNHSAIIGGVIGGTVAFLIIAVILFFFWKRRQRMKNTEPLIIDHGQLPSSWHMGRTGKYGNGEHSPFLKG